MPTVVTVAITAALCLAFMVRSLTRNPANGALRAACLSTLAFLLAMYTVLITAGAEAADPIPAVVWAVSVGQHVLIMAGLCLAMAVLLHSIHLPAVATALVRRHGAVLLAAIAIAVVFASLAPPPDYTAGFVAEYATAPISSLYLLVFALYSMAMIATIAWLSWRWSRLADGPWIRRGLLVGAVGSSAGVGYCGVKAAYIALARLDVAPPVPEQVVTHPLILVSVPLGLVGLTVPGWGPWLTAVNRWAVWYRAHHQLHPLWAALTEDLPHVRMPLGTSRLGRWLGAAWDDRWAPHARDMDLRLHLRVVQIWDARRALQGYCDPAVYEQELRRGAERDRTGDAVVARAEAAMLAAALRRHRRGDPVVGDKSRVPLGTDAADLAANVLWLSRVSQAFARNRY
ncbi:hypothetical protein F4560_007358 [Saccharothrix ecbatanensis]|uniref:DUF6545 domain-containing protein n=1 Tax=Saccharothrix ecbatanensis TaxID=1105145 RepID=A0A7W9HSR9_9PSEU|nr:MAB_1171c family putative transporter [Saccharothrix ecbatanensis]MBB5807590.1 hypothetical protein [Saccharothrix ecbatanensis]